MVAGLCFAVTIHASIVLLFRFVPFPVVEFRRGYDFSFIPTVPLRWLAVVISAASAGICEETGFRGYMQRPMELSHGAPVAILNSSLFFTVLHLTKGWALAGMIPIIFGAGILLGSVAWSSGSLLPCMIGHTIMDIGLFGYWWTGIAGEFTLRPIGETGVDRLSSSRSSLHAPCLRSRCSRYGGSAACVNTCSRQGFRNDSGSRRKAAGG